MTIDRPGTGAKSGSPADVAEPVGTLPPPLSNRLPETLQNNHHPLQESGRQADHAEEQQMEPEERHAVPFS
jgi:hypothetical protein